MHGSYIIAVELFIHSFGFNL